MTALLSPTPRLQFFDNDGTVLAGGKVFTYESGGTTPQSAYTTAAGDIPHANPIVLDSAGRATIFLGAGLTYRFVVKRSDNTTLYTVDGITAGVSSSDLAGYVDLTTDQTINGNKTFAELTAFSVSPTMPTPDAGDNSTKGATTAFVTAAILAGITNGLTLDEEGSITLPGGLILKWGNTSATAPDGQAAADGDAQSHGQIVNTTVTFDVAFPTECFFAMAAPGSDPDDTVFETNEFTYGVSSKTATSMVVKAYRITGSNLLGDSLNFSWFALGR